MKQNTIKDQSKTTQPSSKMVSFRMPMAYINQLQCMADSTGKSKSEILRMGLDVLQTTSKVVSVGYDAAR